MRAAQPPPPTAGNERLTAQVGALLFVLLAALGATIPFARQVLTEHVFIGILLIPPVLLKLGSTGYRFARYYAGVPAYRRAGPPRLLLRSIAPIVVASTLAVFASGVLLLIDGPHDALMGTLHRVTFVIWFAATTIHVLAYVWRVPRLAMADWRRSDDRLGGSVARRLAVAASVAVGIVLAYLTIGSASGWAAG